MIPLLFVCVRRCSKGRVTMTRWGRAPSVDDNGVVRMGFPPTLPWIGVFSLLVLYQPVCRAVACVWAV